MASVSTSVVLALIVILSLSVAPSTIATVSEVSSFIESATGETEATKSVFAVPDSTIAAPAPAPGPSSGEDCDENGSTESGTTTVTLGTKSTDANFLKSNMAFAANKLQLFTKNVVEEKQKTSTDEATKECLSVCNEVYSSAVDALQQGMEDVKNGDFAKANFDMSAFSNNIDTCAECSSKLDDPELQKFEDWLRVISDKCFDKIAKYSTFSLNNLV